MTAEYPSMLIDRPDAIELVRATINAFDFFEPQLQAALDDAGNTHSLDNVFTMVVLGRCEWHADDGCFAVCEHIRFPQCSHFHIWLAGAHPGCGEQLRDLEHVLVRRARELGATHLTMAGRSGWIRATPEHWKAYNSMLRMEVGGAEHPAN
jgi:hypothetical protein